MPIMVLVDCDPDGLNIFRCYRNGITLRGSHASGAVHWLGIKTDQVLEIPISNSGWDAEARSQQDSEPSQGRIDTRASVSSTSCRDPVTLLTTRDRRLAIGILSRLEESWPEDEESREMKRELRIMLCLGVKAEIQWLDESGSLAGWLNEQMRGLMQR